jgi:hypothetical protein
VWNKRISNASMGTYHNAEHTHPYVGNIKLVWEIYMVAFHLNMTCLNCFTAMGNIRTCNMFIW